MPLLRTFLVLLAAVTLGIGTSACGDGSSDDSEATTTTGVVPDDVEEPGDGQEPASEGEDVPADPSTPPTNPGGVNY